MTDYSKGVIYIIRSLNTEINKVYIGSTCVLKKRMREHKHSCKENSKKHHYNLYKYIRENGGWDTFEMTVLEDYPCNNKYELEKRESEVIRECGENVINVILPRRSKKEYYEEHKEEYLLRVKEYREANKETIALKDKEYYQANKEQIALKDKEYREANKEAIALRKKIKIECDVCNETINKAHIRRHQRTQKCLSHKVDL